MEFLKSSGGYFLNSNETGHESHLLKKGGIKTKLLIFLLTWP